MEKPKLILPSKNSSSTQTSATDRASPEGRIDPGKIILPKPAGDTDSSGTSSAEEKPIIQIIAGKLHRVVEAAEMVLAKLLEHAVANKEGRTC